MSSWRTRKRGTKRQKGKKFKLEQQNTSSFKLKAEKKKKKKKRSLIFYGVMHAHRGMIGLDGEVVTYLTNGVTDGHLAKASIIRNGDSLVKMFGRTFIVHLINDGKTLEVHEGAKTYELPWKQTSHGGKRRKYYERYPEAYPKVVKPKGFHKKTVITAIIRGILEPEKESGEWKGGGD